MSHLFAVVAYVAFMSTILLCVIRAPTPKTLSSHERGIGFPMPDLFAVGLSAGVYVHGIWIFGGVGGKMQRLHCLSSLLGVALSYALIENV